MLVSEDDEVRDLITRDGGDVSAGHLPADADGRAVHRLQLNIQRRTQPL